MPKVFIPWGSLRTYILTQRFFPESNITTEKHIGCKVPASTIYRLLAHAGGVSISTLNRLFQQYLHCAPGKYQQEKRLELAYRILSLRSMRVKEAAAECGFSSSTFFCREFKKHTGITSG